MRLNHFFRFAVFAALSAWITFSLTADEGMYPLSEIHKLDLKAKGLRIDARELYNPDGASLVDAICDLGSGTGEFVSPDGLILTNHHIAFTAVAAASTPEKDYLENGFTASTRAEEIPAKDYTCRTVEAYRDVSAEILDGISAQTPPAERVKTIRERMLMLAAKEQAGRANTVCEVSEMYPGKSYVLFTYRNILDVRLVYVPPIAIGEFGGEEDNWVWPRHTGDFSFLRAYVAPDGSTAPYSPNNVPFKPKRYIKVNPKGVKEGDFVFVLGYPGRTYRHKPSHFLRLQQERILPVISKEFDWLIAAYEEAGQSDRAIQLRYADDIKSYANTTKNFKGKLQGMRRLKLVAKKEAEEKELQAFIDADPGRKAKYGTLLADLGKVYNDQITVARQELTVNVFRGASRILAPALALLVGSAVKDQPEDARAKWLKDLEQMSDDVYMPADRPVMRHFLLACAAMDETERPGFVAVATGGKTGKEAERAIDTWLEKAVAESRLLKKEEMKALAGMTSAELTALNDPFIALADAMRKDMDAIRSRQQTRAGELNRLEADLLDVKMAWKQTAFIPDANSTLRLTYGYIKGYNPADATSYRPFTTLAGIAEKNTGEKPFNAPNVLMELSASKRYDDDFIAEGVNDVPVAMLYNMDTTGGNSGSPVMDANGELVGVNFDRAYGATINDYQWSESYSRSIGVDVRYVLFVAKYVGRADFLLDELGVKL